MKFRFLFSFALIISVPHAASAQHAPNRFFDVTPHASSYSTEISVSSVGERLIGPRTAMVLAVVAGLMPVDERISRSMRDSTLQNHDVLRYSKRAMNTYGSPGVLVLSVGALAGGAITGSDGWRDAGLHTTEAIAVSGIVTTIIKEMAGRERPNASPDDPFDFHFAGGLTGEGGRSLPSGHATAAFAFAAAAAEELKLRRPDVARYANPTLYGLAVLAALARVFDQKHWPSDVVLGAAIGTFTGRVITNHAHEDDRE